jgi:hypothetical protein
MGKKKRKDPAPAKAKPRQAASEPLPARDGEDGTVAPVTAPEKAPAATEQLFNEEDTVEVAARFLSEAAAAWKGFGEVATISHAKSAAVLLHDIAPRDGVEKMLAVQMIAAHSTAMRCVVAAMSGKQTFAGMEASINLATKLMRTYTSQIEALNRHRTKARQTVVVKHVHVHEGGQAIVGNVAEGEGGGGDG